MQRAGTLLERERPPELHDEIEDILDAAGEWAAGRLPLTELMRLGTIENNGHPSPGYSRFSAIAMTPASDPRRDYLRKAIRLVVGAQTVITHQGIFSRDELHQHDHAVAFVKANGPAPWE